MRTALTGRGSSGSGASITGADGGAYRLQAWVTISFTQTVSVGYRQAQSTAGRIQIALIDRFQGADWRQASGGHTGTVGSEGSETGGRQPATGFSAYGRAFGWFDRRAARRAEAAAKEARLNALAAEIHETFVEIQQEATRRQVAETALDEDAEQ
jgi:hypothetical protein